MESPENSHYILGQKIKVATFIVIFIVMVSMAGLEPARISPHAPQTCAYTDSATSTCTYYLFSCQILFISVAEC